MKFRTQYDHEIDPGEKNSHELVTEPGQSFTTREIYERFIRTGRVEGMGRPVVFDEDELGRQPDFDDYDVTQRPDFDLSDASNHTADLTQVRSQREEINRLSSLYANGKISYDEFCSKASRQNADLAAPLIEHYGLQLRKNAASQGTSVAE